MGPPRQRANKGLLSIAELQGARPNLRLGPRHHHIHATPAATYDLWGDAEGEGASDPEPLDVHVLRRENLHLKHRMVNDRRAVEVPHEGCSYNPSREAREELRDSIVKKLERKLEKDRKLDKFFTLQRPEDPTLKDGHTAQQPKQNSKQSYEKSKGIMVRPSTSQCPPSKRAKAGAQIAKDNVSAGQAVPSSQQPPATKPSRGSGAPPAPLPAGKGKAQPQAPVKGSPALLVAEPASPKDELVSEIFEPRKPQRKTIAERNRKKLLLREQRIKANKKQKLRRNRQFDRVEIIAAQLAQKREINKVLEDAKREVNAARAPTLVRTMGARFNEDVIPVLPQREVQQCLRRQVMSMVGSNPIEERFHSFQRRNIVRQRKRPDSRVKEPVPKRHEYGYTF